MYEAIDAKNIALYNSNAAAGHPSALPTIFTFHPDVYIALTMEQSANPAAVLDWSQTVTMSVFVPPATPVSSGPHPPTAVVEPVSEDYPGWFELAPDSLAIAVGTTVVISSVTYKKGQYSEDFIGPKLAWQQQ